MPTAKQDKTRKNGLTVKDLIVMGVFGALLMVCSMIGGVLFAVTPTLTFYFSIGAALLPGPVFLLLLAKVPKRWGLTIIGVIISLLRECFKTIKVTKPKYRQVKQRHENRQPSFHTG